MFVYFVSKYDNNKDELLKDTDFNIAVSTDRAIESNYEIYLVDKKNISNWNGYNVGSKGVSIGPNLYKIVKVLKKKIENNVNLGILNSVANSDKGKLILFKKIKKNIIIDSPNYRNLPTKLLNALSFYFKYLFSYCYILKKNKKIKILKKTKFLNNNLFNKIDLTFFLKKNSYRNKKINLCKIIKYYNQMFLKKKKSSVKSYNSVISKVTAKNKIKTFLLKNINVIGSKNDKIVIKSQNNYLCNDIFMGNGYFFKKHLKNNRFKINNKNHEWFKHSGGDGIDYNYL